MADSRSHPVEEGSAPPPTGDRRQCFSSRDRLQSLPGRDRLPQQRASIRMDWGPAGAAAIGAGADFAVVVDILSFSTAVSVALDRGTEVCSQRNSTFPALRRC